MANIVYLDLDSRRVKTCGHAKFDEAWYCQPSRPPAAQLLYDLGLVEASDTMESEVLTEQPTAHLPPNCTKQPSPSKIPVRAGHTPLPLRLTEEPKSVAARAAKLTKEQRWARVQDPYRNTVLEHINRDGLAVENYEISKQDIAQVYFSPHPYHSSN